MARYVPYEAVGTSGGRFKITVATTGLVALTRRFL